MSKMLIDEATVKLALETSEGIVNADWRKWDELASPEEFERWVKSRANHMASVLREALAKPDFWEGYVPEPVKPAQQELTNIERHERNVQKFLAEQPAPVQQGGLEMVDDEGENQAVRMFLALYGGACGVTSEQMRKHLKMAGFDGAWPEWANSNNGHLTKAGAQLWIRHLFALAEQPAQQEPVACVQDLDEVKRKHLVYEKGMDWKDPLYTSPPAQPQQEPVAWRPDVCPITGLPFFMWIEHHETGQNVPTYGGPYDSYTIPVRDKDGSYCRERYDHDLGGWRTDEVEDVGIQIVSDQAYVSDDEPPASKPWAGLPESAFAAMTLQQVSAMKYAELVLKEKNNG